VQAIGRQPQRVPDDASVHYKRHRPEQTTLHRLLQHHTATFFDQLRLQPVPTCRSL
jgi:hypothetical protein